MVNWDRMIKLTPREVTALKKLAAAGPRGRTVIVWHRCRDAS
jgi:hypothetical protein